MPLSIVKNTPASIAKSEMKQVHATWLKPVLHSAVAAALLTASASPVLAATQLGEYFSFSGFGTAGLVKTNSDEGDFVRDRQPVGASTSADFSVDSNLGLQLTGKANSWLSGTVQVLTAQRQEKDHFTAEAEWAFLKVEPLDGLSIRGGRMALPMFAISDFRNVGYANTWIRPPNEVYAMALLTRVEGGDVSYQVNLGSTRLTASALFGSSSFIGPTLTSTDVKHVKGLNLQWETDWVTLRLGQVKGVVVLGSQTDPYTFTGIGALVDRSNVVAQAEYVMRRADTNASIVDADGWYVLGGYRFNSLLPYVSYAKSTPKQPNAPVHLSSEQTTSAIGLRWDAFKSAAIKFQAERVDTNGSAGISFKTPLLPAAPGLPPAVASVTKPVNVFSVAVDFVF